jgi:hypothetical protein
MMASGALAVILIFWLADDRQPTYDATAFAGFDRGVWPVENSADQSGESDPWI